ncbi:hypothetical protein MKW92_013158, partial [Papaver armeniacum]
MPGPLVKSPFTTFGETTPKIPAVGILKNRFAIATDVVLVGESNPMKVRSMVELSRGDVDVENCKRKATLNLDNGCITSKNGATDVQGLGVRGAKKRKAPVNYFNNFQSDCLRVTPAEIIGVNNFIDQG